MLIRVLKRLVFTFMIIYGLDLILKGFNIFIPINYYSLITVGLLGFPGLIMLTLSFFFLL
jgi:hypothetical protein